MSDPRSPTRPTERDLAREINQQHEAAEQAARDALAHALRCGELLEQVKAQTPHGEWLPWIDQHCSFSRRTAQGYMRIWRRRAELRDAQRDAHLPLRDALALLAEPRQDPPQGSADSIPEMFSGLVTAGHAEACEELRTTYGDVVAEFDVESLCTAAGKLATAEDAGAFLYRLRPEQDPQGHPAGEDLIEPCRAFARHVAERDGRVPQSDVARFWWLAFASWSQVTGAQLAVAVHDSCELYRGIMAQWWLWREDAVEDRDRLWWAVRDDVRCARSLDRPVERAWIESAVAAESFLLPSRYQPRPYRELPAVDHLQVAETVDEFRDVAAVALEAQQTAVEVRLGYVREAGRLFGEESMQGSSHR